jgi:hypothetical protein
LDYEEESDQDGEKADGQPRAQWHTGVGSEKFLKRWLAHVLGFNSRVLGSVFVLKIHEMMKDERNKQQPAQADPLTKFWSAVASPSQNRESRLVASGKLASGRFRAKLIEQERQINLRVNGERVEQVVGPGVRLRSHLLIQMVFGLVGRSRLGSRGLDVVEHQGYHRGHLVHLGPAHSERCHRGRAQPEAAGVPRPVGIKWNRVAVQGDAAAPYGVFGLVAVIEAWPDLPEVIKSGILAMLRAASTQS